MPGMHPGRTGLKLSLGVQRSTCSRAPAGARRKVVQLVGVPHDPEGAAHGAVRGEGPLSHVGLGQHHGPRLAQQLHLRPSSSC